ncbi:hypothetical protein D0Z00_004096 [Geotrichum galactomycetum]|uniref:Uncharacterized protein n=1 Tax=Geotrichum galactomycetum TaxID=27317 RepID=A0ACB6UZD8_9ASCO|nr:hypothetical protein D0Z00_004096 [Geotrichum candidum]
MAKTQQSLNQYFGIKTSASAGKKKDPNQRTLFDSFAPKSPKKREAEKDESTQLEQPAPKHRKRNVIEDDEEPFVNQQNGKENDVKDEPKEATKVPTSPKRAKSPKSNSPKPRSPSLKKSSDTPEKVITADQTELQSSSDDEKAIEEGYISSSDSETPLQDIPSITQTQKNTPSKVKLLDGKYLPYSLIVNTFEQVESTSSRLKIIAYTSELFLEVLRTSPEDLSTVAYLCINRLGPDYEGLELGLGESLIIKSLAEATGRTQAQIKTDYRDLGDLGEIAMKSRNKQPTMFKPKPLSINVVFKNLEEIAKTTGASSQNKKIGIIKRMLTACEGPEAKFLVRSLEGKLRIGLAEKSVLTALAQAFVAWESEKFGKKSSEVDVSNAEVIIRDVHCQIPNYGLIIDTAIKDGVFNVPEKCKLTAGVPLKPMLAKPTKSVSEILDRFGGEVFTCEYKYDGERAQVHLQPDGTIKVYSRNMEDMTQRYPDLLAGGTKFAKEDVKSYILDCEAVAWDRQQKKILPFQVLSTRKRKDVEAGEVKVQICLFAFDVLYLNGESLLKESLTSRREILKSHFITNEGQFSFAQYMDSSNVDEIQTFLDQSVKDSCEGLMIKVLNGEESGYEPSKRSRNWLKLKKDYLAGVGDSLDLVVLGAYYGRGKRTNAYGAYLLGCYNSETEEYETICKIGTGFSDEILESLYNQLKLTIITAPKSYFSYDKGNNTQPDVWFEPSMVWEVLTADLSLSPIYKAGIDQLGKGISLRFPRFIRIRDDKGIEDATTSEQVVSFYQRQASVQNNQD